MVEGTVRTNWLFSYLPLFPSSPLSFKDITDLGLSCMADYGAPVFPFLAVGGYQGESSTASWSRGQKASVQRSASSLQPGEDFTNAEALLLTFSLNNYPRNNAKFNVAMQWEAEFLKIVQEYQRNSSTNFTFAYMAEVRPALRPLPFIEERLLTIDGKCLVPPTEVLGGRDQPDDGGGHSHFHDQLRCDLCLHRRGAGGVHLLETHSGQTGLFLLLLDQT